MLNTPAVLQSKIDALNLTQMIMEHIRYDPKSVNIGTLVDIILTNLPHRYHPDQRHILISGCSDVRLQPGD